MEVSKQGSSTQHSQAASQAKTSQQTIADQLITDGATNAAEGQLWGTRLAAYYILVSTTAAAAAATIRRQMNINAKGFET